MKVLLVEDSRTVRVYVEGVLRDAPGVELLPSAADGAEGVAKALAARPDLVLMDLELPVLDGISAIRRIMSEAPCPIVVLSAHLAEPGSDRTFEALEAGAVEVLAKPSGADAATIGSFGARLLSTARTMAEARVVRRRPSAGMRSAPMVVNAPAPCALVAVGASTGGPPVLHELLGRIYPRTPVPIVVAQHTIPGFEPGLARWLAQTGHEVVVADRSMPLRPGVVYLARADRNVALRPGEIAIVDGDPRRPIPSVDVLFESAADVYGDSAVGVLLTGMGDDGARGLLALSRRGALTVTQSGATCVVNGMPEAARREGASSLELAPAQIADLLGSSFARLRRAEPR